MGSIKIIGTRDSQLALWQANYTKTLLEEKGLITELKPVKSEGDLNLTTPLYEMGVQGIFTKTLDIALLNKEIDIAVHSYKDVPTELPKGIVKAAVLPRADHRDLFVPNISVFSPELMEQVASGNIVSRDLTLTIASSSTRRKAQWLNRFQKDEIVPIRGNVNNRLKKLSENNWHGAIFAKAGLERINLVPEKSIVLDWMVPAPAQGAILVVVREGDHTLLEQINKINNYHTDICTAAERSFLRTLMGGCTTPISAYASIQNNQIQFTGQLLSLDGKEKLSVQLTEDIINATALGKKAGMEIIQKGGMEIINKIKSGA